MGTLALYAEAAIMETPLALRVLPGSDGVLRGKSEIRRLFEQGAGPLRGAAARWYRTGLFFSNGRQLVWEYPRTTPEGDQLDLVEVMDIADGLIAHHRVYWGCRGVAMLMEAH